MREAQANLILVYYGLIYFFC